MGELPQGLSELLEAETDLSHVLAWGWTRPRGEKLFSAKIKQDSSQTKHDPEAVTKYERFSVEVATIAVQYAIGLGNFRYHNVESFGRIYRHLEDSEEQRKLAKLDKRLGRLAADTNGWLVDRQIQVLGCNPPDDCHTIDRVCGHASISGCKLNRK